MNEIIDAAVSWKTIPLGVLVLGVTFGLAPDLVLNLAVLMFPKGHPRRTELVNELQAVPFLDRAFWVFSALGVTITEGLPERIRSARASRSKPDNAPRDPQTGTDSNNASEVAPADKTKSTAEADGTTKIKSGSVDTDWFRPLEVAAVAALDEDFLAWRAEFPEFYDLTDPNSAGYPGSLTITPKDVRAVLGPRADAMTYTNVEVDELIRLINAGTAVLPVIPDELGRGQVAVQPVQTTHGPVQPTYRRRRQARRGRHRA